MNTNKLHQHRFTSRDLGISVVFAGFDGGSYSAQVVDVTPDYVRVRYIPTVQGPVTTMVVRADWHRLTRFPAGSKFLAIAS